MFSSCCIKPYCMQSEYCFPKLLGPARFSPTPFSDIMSYICKTNSIFTKFHKIFTLCIILWAPQRPDELLKFACNKVILCAVRAFCVCVLTNAYSQVSITLQKHCPKSFLVQLLCSRFPSLTQPLICFCLYRFAFFRNVV